MKYRRRTQKCKGKCDKANCKCKTTIKADFKRHVRKVRRIYKKKACPHCKKNISTSHLARHIQRMHTDKKYERKRLSCPFPEDPKGWALIKKLVVTNEQHDKSETKLKIWSKEDKQELLARDNKIRHDIAIQLYKRWQAMGEYDDAGGYVKGKLHLESYSLHKLSADRIDNDRPHFVGNGLSNINLVSAGINTQCNIVSIYGKDTCKMLRERSKKIITQAEIQVILEREKNSQSKIDGKKKNNVVYQSSYGAYRKDGKLHFASPGEMFKYTYNLLVQQKATCTDTGVLMDEHRGTKKRLKNSTNLFQPSLNAINPSLGHRPGNLEWVCAFVNSSDRDKQNDKKGEVATGWTKESFKSYIGIE
jgi:hypothetical protein